MFTKSTNRLLAISRPPDTRLVLVSLELSWSRICARADTRESQPWPIVESFLRRLEPGSVGLDVGCGNGKYLTVNQDIFIIASDRWALM